MSFFGVACNSKFCAEYGAVVVALMVEWSLQIPEVRGSNPVISKHLCRTFTVDCIEKTKIKKKSPGMVHFVNFGSVEVWSTCGIIF